jgi:hypothetical protein
LSIGGGKKGSTEKPSQPQNANSWGSEASSSSCNSSLWKINKSIKRKSHSFGKCHDRPLHIGGEKRGNYYYYYYQIKINHKMQTLGVLRLILLLLLLLTPSSEKNKIERTSHS